MNDYRDEETRARHESGGWTQEQIDIWNRGYEFHKTHWPDDAPSTPVREAMQFADYSMIDLSPEADIFWSGYEQGVLDKTERGLSEYDQPATEADMEFAMQEVLRFLKGDRK